jgi:hypothetical protein
MNNLTYTLDELPGLLEAGWSRTNMLTNQQLSLEFDQAVSNHRGTLNFDLSDSAFYQNTNIKKLLERSIPFDGEKDKFTQKKSGYDIYVDDGTINWSDFTSWNSKHNLRILDYFQKHNYLALYQSYFTANKTLGDLGFLNSLFPTGIKAVNGRKTNTSIKYSNNSSNLSCNTLVVDVGKNASLYLTEVFDCKHTEISKIVYIVRENAKLYVDRYIKPSANTAHYIESHVVHYSDSECQFEIKASSANDFNMQTFDVSSFHNCKTEIIGRTRCADNNTNVIVANVRHRGKNSQSKIDVKSTVADSSTASFKGCITIEKSATDTVAHMQNKNLQLSESAKIFTEPKLDIATKEVECSHGCTISNVSDEELFYLESKGITTDEARALLLNSFMDMENYERFIPDFI